MSTRVQIPLSAPQNGDGFCPISILLCKFEGDLRVEPFCGSKTLCLTVGGRTIKKTAKDDVDNVGAGRAAKGANPSLCATKGTS